jgi:hypothetical protein
MLAKSDIPIEHAVKVFAQFGVEAGYIVPTLTGLKKAIIDAHASLRDFLKLKGIHDYETQTLGQDGKKLVKTWLVEHDCLIERTTSLYRPETKLGDPRIWISNLSTYAEHFNLLALLVDQGEIYIINVSRPDLLVSAQDPSSPLGRLLGRLSDALTPPAVELLSKLRQIAARGFIESMRTGPTGIGMTLETLLGIRANSNKAPDFKGIELKASRVSPRKRRSACRVNLFSQVPDWGLSACRSGFDLLSKHGYYRDGRLQLYCTVGPQPNPQGLYSEVDEKTSRLNSLHRTKTETKPVACWPMEILQARLAEKHRETFWVKAHTRQTSRGSEEFEYFSVVHTRGPLLANVTPLLALGVITFDYTLSLKSGPSGRKEVARDHGYLFKISPEDLGALFPPSRTHSLIS